MDNSLTNFLQGLSNWQIQTIFTILAIWSVAWKGSALYHASRHEEKIWFIVLLLVNTVGLLEIAYIFFISKEKVTLGDLQIYLEKAKHIRNLKLANIASKKKSEK